MSTGVESFSTTTASGRAASTSTIMRSWSCGRLGWRRSAPSVATMPAMITTTSDALAAATASPRFARSDATVTFSTRAEEPSERNTSAMPSTGATVYSGSTFDDPPPPLQATSTKGAWPTMSTVPSAGGASGRRPSFFSSTASWAPMRREIAPCAGASMVPGS